MAIAFPARLGHQPSAADIPRTEVTTQTRHDKEAAVQVVAPPNRAASDLSKHSPEPVCAADRSTKGWCVSYRTVSPIHLFKRINTERPE
jgi:hypothetical protein